MSRHSYVFVITSFAQTTESVEEIVSLGGIHRRQHDFNSSGLFLLIGELLSG